MKLIKSHHVVRIFNREEDETYVYLVCEYCDGGDLFDYQLSKPRKHFSLGEAVEILSQVIKGLAYLH